MSSPEAVQAAVDRLLSALVEMAAAEHRPEDVQDSLPALIVGARLALAVEMDAGRLTSSRFWDALAELASAVREHLTKGLADGH